MGLTGIITEVALQLLRIESPYMMVQHQPARDLDASLSLLSDKNWDDDYSVAWIDCVAGRKLGRSILIRGHHASRTELPPALQRAHTSPKSRPRELRFGFPSFALNRFTMAAFNETFYRWQGRRTETFIDTLDRFFFPLDRIAHWNRMYGKRGFVQYQFVLPLEAKQGLIDIMRMIGDSGMGSFLTVLKVFGKQDSLISFPKEGYTLAMDFAVKDGLMEFLDKLDEIVLRNGGRLYMSKDARMKPHALEAGYPKLEEFKAIVKKYNGQNKFCSVQSDRLLLTKN